MKFKHNHLNVLRIAWHFSIQIPYTRITMINWQRITVKKQQQHHLFSFNLHPFVWIYLILRLVFFFSLSSIASLFLFAKVDAQLGNKLIHRNEFMVFALWIFRTLLFISLFMFIYRVHFLNDKQKQKQNAYKYSTIAKTMMWWDNFPPHSP